MKKRADLLLVEKNLAETRSKAQAMIMAGQVSINGKIVLLISNNPDCKAVIFAKSNNIEVSIINQEIMSDCNKYENFLYKVLKKEEIDLIVLAGYLKIIPIKVGFGSIPIIEKHNPLIKKL